MSYLAKLSGREVVSRDPKPKVRKGMKSKQRAVTALEKSVWDRMCREVGCVACMARGQQNSHVSIHHIDGRTKPGCHKKVLPLCAPHHQQDDSCIGFWVAVHPDKARFESLYGSQAELLAWVLEYLRLNPDFTPIL